jgi:hypothetical protein
LHVTTPFSSAFCRSPLTAAGIRSSSLSQTNRTGLG